MNNEIKRKKKERYENKIEREKKRTNVKGQSKEN